MQPLVDAAGQPSHQTNPQCVNTAGQESCATQTPSRMPPNSLVEVQAIHARHHTDVACSTSSRARLWQQVRSCDGVVHHHSVALLIHNNIFLRVESRMGRWAITGRG